MSTIFFSLFLTHFQIWHDHSEIVSVEEITERKPIKIKNFGIWLEYESGTSPSLSSPSATGKWEPGIGPGPTPNRSSGRRTSSSDRWYKVSNSYISRCEVVEAGKCRCPLVNRCMTPRSNSPWPAGSRSKVSKEEDSPRLTDQLLTSSRLARRG
jgi:hypothetical protein